jgi:para-aminobenzoate synthetase component 1
LEHEIPLPAGGAFALFERIRDLPWAILLHSGTEDGGRGHWDILSAAPRRVLILGATLPDTPSQDAACEAFDSGDALLARARSLLAAMRAEAPAVDTCEDVPFRWGMLGYLGYEARHDAFGLTRAARNDGLPAAALGEYTWSVRIDRRAGRAWFSAQRDDDRTRAMLARLRSTQYPPDRDVAALATPQHARCEGPGWRAPDPEHYARGFATVQSYLRAGDCYQVNLARHFTLPWQGDAWPLFARLVVALPAAFGAFFATPFGAVLCCSPERLLQVRARTAISQPIKGTSKRSSSPEEDQRLVEELKTSQKDLAENLMITDLARNDLGRVAVPGSVQVPELFAIRTLPTVHHLESTVRARLAAGKDAIDALQACFPAGSITGAPKRRAMEVIAELEPDGRSAYCGSIGYLDAGGNCDFNVAIRTLTIERSTLNCWGGGGIVADSTLEEELREIDHKVGALRAAATSAADRA